MGFRCQDGVSSRVVECRSESPCWESSRALSGARWLWLLVVQRNRARAASAEPMLPSKKIGGFLVGRLGSDARQFQFGVHPLDELLRVERLGEPVIDAFGADGDVQVAAVHAADGIDLQAAE